MEKASESFTIALSLEDAPEILRALEQTNYYLTWMRAQRNLGTPKSLNTVRPVY